MVLKCQFYLFNSKKFFTCSIILVALERYKQVKSCCGFNGFTSIILRKPRNRGSLY
ncbi:hypothetical protein [Methanobacterium congolense]|uniref:hypothetical protein n=1 Tax=Methanobacterium congolense TaxID=118062 RepID=UPI001E37865C|nr:hypothetical protein [Methanobacterium congolense]